MILLRILLWVIDGIAFLCSPFGVTGLFLTGTLSLLHSSSTQGQGMLLEAMACVYVLYLAGLVQDLEYE